MTCRLIDKTYTGPRLDMELQRNKQFLRVLSNYQRGHTGQMSLITAGMNAAGLVVGILFLNVIKTFKHILDL